MSTLLENTLDLSTHSDELRSTMAAVRVSMKWFGTRKSVSNIQKTEAARPFNAEGKFLSVGKKLIDTSHPAWKAVTSVRSNILRYWRDRSLPFPEDGIRLVKRLDIDTFNETMRVYQNDLDEAVWRLNEHYDELKVSAQRRLGRLYQESDYPLTLIGMFEVTWDYPNVEPPNYLMDYNPRLFREESQRVRSRFDEAVRLAEEAFTSELSKLVTHLVEKLSGDTDGKPKIFRDTAVTNLSEFFERFRRLSIGSNEELEQVVHQARMIVGGIPAQELRDSVMLRQQISGQLSDVQTTLDRLMIDRPRRNLIRPNNRKCGTMQVIITSSGVLRTLYSEIFDFETFGQQQITRASYVEPDIAGHWYADLSPVKGPRLGPFAKRSDALTAEADWINHNIF